MEDESNGDSFSGLPESCISYIISLTSPTDACRSAAVSTTFQLAADSDTVWNRFIPSDYLDILSRSVRSLTFTSKKDLYFQLCSPVVIDGGRMSFELERSSGKKCYMIWPRAMNIVWSENPRFWKWAPSSNLSFPEIVELLNVCWLELNGKFEARSLSPKTSYAANLMFKVQGDRSNGLDFPAEASVKVETNVVSECEVQLYDTRRVTSQFVAGMPSFGYFNSIEEEASNQLHGNWEKLKIGEFYIDDGDEGEVEISLKEAKGGHWKRGLLLQGIEVRPML